MKKTTCFILMFMCLSVTAVGEDKHFVLFQEQGYKAGYEAGKQEYEEGCKFEPEIVLAQPIYQQIMAELNEEFNYIRFKEAFKKGFFDGYSDGYYSRPKKKMRFL